MWFWLKDNAYFLAELALLFLAGMLFGGWLYERGHPTFEDGYRAAWEDHNANRIDCVVSVKHPEWLKEGK